MRGKCAVTLTFQFNQYVNLGEKTQLSGLMGDKSGKDTKIISNL